MKLLCTSHLLIDNNFFFYKIGLKIEIKKEMKLKKFSILSTCVNQFIIK